MYLFPGEDKSLLQKIEDLKKQLETVDSSTNQVNKWTKQAAIATEMGEKNVTSAEKTIERIQTNYKVGLFYIGEGRNPIKPLKSKTTF